MAFEWIAIAVISGLIYGVKSLIDYSNEQDELSRQEDKNNLDAYNSSMAKYNELLNEVDNALLEVDKENLKKTDQQSIIDTNAEWLANYEKMLAGDRTDTVLGRNLASLQDKKTSLENERNLLEQNKTLAEKQASAYLSSSAVEKQSNYETAFDKYTQMLKQKSLLNIAASGSGQEEGAYRVAQLIQSQQIRNYIGVDLVFNTDNGESEYNSNAGSFLNAFSSLQKGINTTIYNNNLQIELAKNNLLDNEFAIKSANSSILDFYEEVETTANKKKSETKIAQDTINITNKTIERLNEKIKRTQENATEALKQANEAKGKIEKKKQEQEEARKAAEQAAKESAKKEAAEAKKKKEQEEAEKKEREKKKAEAKAREDARKSTITVRENEKKKEEAKAREDARKSTITVRENEKKKDNKSSSSKTNDKVKGNKKGNKRIPK